MRAVVTGGAGFIGSHLIEALLAAGHEVVCIERRGAPMGWVRGFPIAFENHGLGSIRDLARTLDGADVVFHLAGLTQARRPADYYAVNTEGTANVLAAAAQYGSRSPRVILASSIAAIGPCRNGEPLSSDTVPYPLSHYGHSKLLAEAMVHAYADRVPAVVFRLSSVYGPRERGVLMLFKLVQRGIALTVGGWHREVSLLYVADLVQGLLAAATRYNAVGHTYCLSHPEPTTWAGFAEEVGNAVGRRPTMLSIPTGIARLVAIGSEAAAALRRQAAILNRERVREITQLRWVCDVSAAIRDLAFRPAYPITRGVATTAAWYREAQWI